MCSDKGWSAGLQAGTAVCCSVQPLVPRGHFDVPPLYTLFIMIMSYVIDVQVLVVIASLSFTYSFRHMP